MSSILAGVGDGGTRPVPLRGSALPCPPRARLFRLLAVAYLGAVLFIGLLAVVSRALARPFSYLSRDPASAVGDAWYAGFLSNVGILLWTVAATACLLTWWSQHGRSENGTGLLLWAGTLTTAELLDDLFLLHDALYPMLGVPEQAVVAVYGLATLALAVFFRERLGRPGLVAVGLTLGLFAASFVVDQAWPGHHEIEDGFKFLGIVTWALYFVVLSAAQLNGQVRPPWVDSRHGAEHALTADAPAVTAHPQGTDAGGTPIAAGT